MKDKNGREVQTPVAQSVTIPRELFDELITALQWSINHHNDVTSIAPEYRQRHPDPGALDYLENETRSIYALACAHRDSMR